jgi:Leucine-rich repeat (LRR) protein
LRGNDFNADTWANMGSLNALNLERNLIRTLAPDSFAGLHETLSSLSLLNNLIEVYPLDALRPLTGLRVSSYF